MMKKILFSFVFLLLSLPVLAETTQPVSQKHLDELQSLIDMMQKPFSPKRVLVQVGENKTYKIVEENYEQVFDLIAFSENPTFTPWLRRNIGEYSPYFLYAMALRRSREKATIQEVFFWLTAAKLRIGADSALCVDENVKMYFRILNDEYEMRILEPYRGTPEAIAFDKNPIPILREAVEWDLAAIQKNSPDWFCKSGYATATTNAYPQNEWDQRRNEFKKNYTAPLYQ